MFELGCRPTFVVDFAKTACNDSDLIDSVMDEKSIAQCSGKLDTQTVRNRDVELIGNMERVFHTAVNDITPFLSFSKGGCALFGARELWLDRWT
jgi:hypothetical protein